VKNFLCIGVLLMLLWPGLVLADDAIQLLARISRAYNDGQSGLKQYQVTVETDKIAELLAQMTASLPKDAPRPEQPMIRKYWLRSSGRTLMRAEGLNVFPFMQEMVGRFSREFSIDLHQFLLPAGRSGIRQQILATAKISQSDSQVAGAHRISFEILFPVATDLQQAFFAEGLNLPQNQVEKLVLDVDPDQLIVSRLEISQPGKPALTVEVRHQKVAVGQLPSEIRVSTPDGSIDDLFRTEFVQLETFWLPSRQERISRRGGLESRMQVGFKDYQLNGPLPPGVAAVLND